MSSPLLRLAAVVFATVLALTVQAGITQQSKLPVSQSQLQNGTSELPSLRLNFTIKRQAMQVYGQSTFTMLANPVVSNDSLSVLYDAFATFTESTTRHNYTLVNGTAFMLRTSEDSIASSTVRCLDSEVLPQINSIVSAINEAVPISSASTASGAIQCSSGNLFKVSVNGIDFALCASGSSGFTLFGSDMDIAVEYLSSPVNISVPTLDSEDARKCKFVASSNVMTSIGRALLQGESLTSGHSRQLKSAFGFKSLASRLGFNLDLPSCSCKSTPRPCIFIHGMGISPEMPENQDSFPKYWGNLTGHTPCCTSLKYARLDTKNHSWTSFAQQRKVCDRALSARETNQDQGTAISDTIIVTHSMGGLMMAGAIANGFCSLDSSSTWLSLGSPLTGSMGSDYTLDACEGNKNYLLEKFANITGRCPVRVATRSLAYENEAHSSARLNAAYKAAQKVYRKHVTAAVCSNSYQGLLSNYEWQFWLLGRVVPHKSQQNDGMVEYQSCRGGLPESKFGNSYLDPFYVTKVNHFDLQFLSGDAVMDKAKMPVKWLECVL